MGSTALIPLTAAEKLQWTSAPEKVSATLANAKDWAAPAPHRHVYVASFDGTDNDRNAIAKNEVATNPAQIEASLSHFYDGNTLQGKYYPGVGTQYSKLVNAIDSATGHGAQRISEQAYADFNKTARGWLAEDPNAEIKVVAIGFSRGAASARQFLNLVDDRGIEGNAAANTLRPAGSVHSAALLFDTVSTGQDQVLDQKIPASTDYVIHLTSKDEPRVSFPLTSIKEGAALPDSRLELTLPGVHSDIGGGYPNGPDKMAKYVGDVALSKLGLPVAPGMAPLHALEEGRHDSSWSLTPVVKPFAELVDGPGRNVLDGVPRPVTSAVENFINSTLDLASAQMQTLHTWKDELSAKAEGVGNWFATIVSDGKGCLLVKTNCSDISVDLQRGLLSMNGDSFKLEKHDVQAIANGQGVSFELPRENEVSAAPRVADNAAELSR